MTIEEKARAYDEAVNKLRRFMAQGVEPLITRADVQDFFPELAESEDEKIRKSIIAFLKENLETGRAEETWSLSGLERWIAWLEKQGEKPQGKSALEAAKEEKVDNANKVEPKFHQGEWIVWQGKCYKVNYNGCGYELVDQNGLNTSLEYGTIDESAHLWEQNLTSSAKTCKNDTILDLLRKMPPFITVDGIDYHFVMKKTSIYIAYYACYKGNREEYSGNAILWVTAFSPIDLLTAMLEKLKEKGLLE